jgi:hypothetical protein
LRHALACAFIKYVLLIGFVVPFWHAIYGNYNNSTLRS